MSASPTAPVIESWRVGFPLAAALGAGGLGVWAVQLAGVPLGVLPADHGAFMIWGVLGSAIQGFLLTAYAKQNGATLTGRGALLGLAGAQVLSALVLFTRPALPVGVAVVLTAAPWVGMLVWAVRVAIPSLRRGWDATTAAVPVALASGLIGVVLHVTGAVAPRGVDVGAQAFVAPMALAVLDRVLPFFSRNAPGYTGARRPWFLGPLLALLWVGLLVPSWSRFTAAAIALLLIRQWVGWQPFPAARVPMIGVLHVGVGWFLVATSLTALGATRSASIHALAVGGLGTLLFAISMRVVRGHSGLPMVVGRAGAAVLIAAQLAAVVRVGVGQLGGPPWLLVASGAVLGVAFVGWLIRFLPTCFSG